MFLAIDVGNTNCVFAAFDKAGTVMRSWRLKTDHGRAADEYASFLLPLLQTLDVSFSDFETVLIGSVVPAVDRHLERFVKSYLSLDPVFIDPENVNVKIDLDNQREIGADRLLNARAVIAEYDLPAIVVDLGTATTFDVIDEKGTYLGGSIAPGIRLSVAALEAAAAKLPSVDVIQTKTAIGRSTKEAIQSGIYWGYVGLIRGILDKIEDDLGIAKTVIATGGLAPLFIDAIDKITIEDQDLTLKGLQIICKDIKT